MGITSQTINDWIENTFNDRTAYAEDFMDSLEKEFPKLHNKFMVLLYEYAGEMIE